MLLSALLLASSPALAFTPDVSQLQSVPLHMVHAPLAKAIESAATKGEPYRFAVRADFSLALTDGTWDQIDASTSRWRMRVTSPGAQSLNLEFARFHLPEGASLWLYDLDGKMIQGPYTAADQTPEGKLWTAIVPGDQLVLELRVPTADRDDVQLALGAVNHGFRGFGKALGDPDPEAGPGIGLGASGSCNIDSICPQGNGWRPQIRAVARYTLGGNVLCTGQLINDVPQDEIPYFLTANHCEIGQAGTPASSMVVYWRFENSVCNGADNADPTFTQSGSTLIASDSKSDFALVRLNHQPAASFNVYFTGWSAAGAFPTSGAVFHHPSGDAKKLAIYDANSPAQPIKNQIPFNGDTVDTWEVTYSQGTTEQGSSGGGLLDQNHHLIGTLSAGEASCSQITGSDDYGRFDVAWNTKTSSSQQLKHWLDPNNTGTLIVDGHEPTVNTNHQPIAVGDNEIVGENSAQIVFDPRANDSDSDGDPLTITAIGTPAHGTASILSNGTRVGYTPATGYVGSDSLSYTISDGHGGTASADISINVSAAPPSGGGGGGGAMSPLMLLIGFAGTFLRRRIASR